MQHLFDRESEAGQAARIAAGIFEARSPRLSDISQHMAGTPSANDKAIQRFIGRTDLKGALRRLFQADAEFVIGDPTEMPRPQAYKTDYGGKLSDGETRGFWLLVLATPFRGWAIPCSLLSYSSHTIAQGAGSRNLHHWQAFADLKALLGEKPLVLDRDFSYLELLQYCVAADLNFVIRLNLRSHPPKFYTAPATHKSAARRCKWQMCSGLFILLKQKLALPADRWRQLIDQALQAFVALVCPPVRT